MSLYNMLHGRNPIAPIYLGMLGFTPDDVPRFRDVHLIERDDGHAIAVYTRMGGGNRGHWDFTHADDTPGPECPCPGCRAQHVLGRHPCYLYDQDDDFDSTYATYYFRVPEAFREQVAELAELGGQKDVPAESWERLFRKMADADLADDAEVQRWVEVGKPLVEGIAEAFRQQGGSP